MTSVSQSDAITTFRPPRSSAVDPSTPSVGPHGRPPQSPRGPSAAHTRMVRILRVALPSIAGLLVLYVAVGSHITRHKDAPSSESAVATAHEDISMVKPRYFGRDRQSRRFSVSAQAVRDLEPGGHKMSLIAPEADITLEDGAWVSVQAEEAAYNGARKELNLEGSVALFHDAGYELRTESASVDLENGRIWGTEHVEGHGVLGDLSAEGFHVANGGDIIVFTGNARLLLRSAAREAK